MLQPQDRYLSLFPCALKEPLPEIPQPRASMREIACLVAEAHGLTLKDLRCPSEVRLHAFPRHEAMWMIRQTQQFSYPQIGRFFGRDHSTVISGCRAHERRNQP